MDVIGQVSAIRGVCAPRHTVRVLRPRDKSLVVASSAADDALMQVLPPTAVAGPVARQEAVR